MQEKTILDYFKEAFTKNYFNFSGRARRKEFWGFVLINLIIVLLISSLLPTESDRLILGSIYFLLTIIPSCAIAVRRLHDIDRSAWNLFYILVPLIGFILLFVLFISEGVPRITKYGINPKGVAYEIVSIGNEQYSIR